MVRVHMSRNVSLIDNWSNAHKITVIASTDITQSGNVNVTGSAFPPSALEVMRSAGLLPPSAPG